MGQLPLSNLGVSPDLANILITTLPLGFYDHDRPGQLLGHLSPALEIWHQPELLLLSLSLNGASGLLFRGQTSINSLVPRLTHTFSLPELPSILSPFPTITTPSLVAFGFGFNCFLATPDQFWLALQQASKCTSMPALATLVAGALAGTFCSIWGMPVLAPNAIREELFHVADILFADWCGVDPNLATPVGHLPIASPGILRPR
jgi:hypothetical protein